MNVYSHIFCMLLYNMHIPQHLNLRDRSKKNVENQNEDLSLILPLNITVTEAWADRMKKYELIWIITKMYGYV